MPTSDKRNTIQARDVAALGGAAVLGDTYRQLGNAREAGEQMLQLHAGLANRNFADLKDPDALYALSKAYGSNAQKALNTRLLGVPFSRLGRAFPLSTMAEKDTKVRMSALDLLRHHLGLLKTDKYREDRLNHSYEHYAGYADNPGQTQFREFTTGNALGGAHKLSPEFMEAGLDNKTWGDMLRDPAPVKRLMAFAKISPNKAKLMAAMHRNFGGGLYTGGLDTEKFFAGELPNVAAVLKTGPSAYGNLIRNVARFGRPVAGAGALGLLGYEGLRRLGKKQASTQDHRTAEGVAGGGLLAGSLIPLHNYNLYQPSNTIVSTAGQLKPPLSPVDIGAGHITPAKALEELLRKHPAAQSGDFNVTGAYREMDPSALAAWQKANPNHKGLGLGELLFRDAGSRLAKPFSMQHHAGAPTALMMLDSGFGANYPDYAVLPKAKFNWNPDGGIGFVPDYVHDASDMAGKGAFLNPFGHVTGKMPVITFGKEIPEHLYPANLKKFFHSEVHPLLQQSVIDNAKSWLSGERNAGQVWNHVAEQLAATDPSASATLQNAVQAGKKIITVSGSSRGDLVAHRAAALQELLQQHGLSDKFQIVAALGNAKGHSTDMSANLLDSYPQIVQLGHTGRYKGVDMNDLIHAADFHLGSTGASAQAESMLSATPTAFTTHFRGKAPGQAGALDEQLAALKARGLDTKHFDGHPFPLDAWNSGVIKHIKADLAGKNIGIEEANQASDLLPFLKRLASGESLRFADRATRQLEATDAARSRLADAIMERAAVLRSQASNGRLRSLGLGGALAGAGAYGLWRSRQDPTQEPNRIKQMFQHLLDRARQPH